jgi:gamma-glutamyl hydrolase
LEAYLLEVHHKYNSLLDLDRLQVDIPVVGILTMPTTPERKTSNF